MKAARPHKSKPIPTIPGPSTHIMSAGPLHQIHLPAGVRFPLLGVQLSDVI